MNKYTDVLDTYLSQHPQQLGCGEIDSLLGMLYCCYHQCRGSEPEPIRKSFKDLDAIMSQLSLEDNNRVFCVTVSLCQEYQKNAFQEGLLIGMRLYRELTARQ